MKHRWGDGAIDSFRWIGGQLFLRPRMGAVWELREFHA